MSLRTKVFCLFGIAIQILGALGALTATVVMVDAGNARFLFLLPAAMCSYFAWDLWKSYRELKHLRETTKELEELCKRITDKANAIIAAANPEVSDE